MNDTTHAITLFVEGDVLYDAMLADIALAQSAIRLESYIFADDQRRCCWVATTASC